MIPSMGNDNEGHIVDVDAMIDSIVDDLPPEPDSVKADRVKLTPSQLNSLTIKKNFRALGDHINHQNIQIGHVRKEMSDLILEVGRMKAAYTGTQQELALLKALQNGIGSGPTVPAS
jgi:hypothetical protein